MSNLQADLFASRRQALDTDSHKHELVMLEKRLLREQNKTKALSEELETPLNVHRLPPITTNTYCPDALPPGEAKIYRDGSAPGIFAWPISYHPGVALFRYFSMMPLVASLVLCPAALLRGALTFSEG